VPDIAWQVSAQESVSTSIGRISQALAGLDASDAKTFGQMVRNLSNAETATIRTATALQRLETVQAQTDAAQSRAASAALRLSQAQEQAARGYRDVGQAATQHAPAAASFFSNALSAATGFLAANVFSRVASGFGDIIGGVVGASASMEQTRAGFSSVLQSAQAADDLIRQLQTEANKSPFNLEQFRAASQLLLGMGVAAQEVVPRLHEVSNVVAATGGGVQQFESVNRALAQIQAKGKVSAEEINQLAEAGVAGWQILATALNLPIAKVQELSQAGAITADTFNQAFAAFANSKAIAKAAEDNSHTWNGLVSTIGDVGQALETAFGTPALQAAEPTIERIVAALQNPAVINTVSQWGAAAGQFVTGLLQAGETAFNVGGQILSALRPVTDMLGQLLGINLGTGSVGAFTPPDLSGPSLSAAQFSSNIQQAGPAAKSAADQVKGLEAQTRELSRASAEVQSGFAHQIDPLREQIRVMDEIAQREDRAASIGELQKKIAKDRALAVDAYSSQGQAAASRLVDEESQLAKLQRDQGRAGAKDAIQDRIAALEQAKKSAQENAQAQERALARQQDALRATATAATALTTALTGGPDKSKNRNVNDAFGDTQTASKAQTTVGWLQQLSDALNGDKGVRASIDAVGTAWGQLTGAFAASDPGLKQLQESIGEIAHALGLDSGFAAQAVIGQAAFKTFAEVSAAQVPQNLAIVGAGLRELNNQFTVTARGLQLVSDTLKGADQGTINKDMAALGQALTNQDADRKAGVAGYLQQVAKGQQNTGAIFQQNYADAIQGLLTANGQGLLDRGPTNTGPDFGPGVTTTTASRNAPPRAEVVLTFDENGVAHAIQKHTSADRLLRVMGDAVR
jgi:tape measure domain-containing protein